MDKRKLIQYGLGGAAIVALFLISRKSGANSVTAIAPVQLGGADVGSVDFGDFQSSLNVEVNPNAYHGLAQQFMPLFGFVGVGVAGAAPIQQTVNVNVQTATIQPPTRVSRDVFINSHSVQPNVLDRIELPSYTSGIQGSAYSNGTLREAMMDIYGRQGYVMAGNDLMVRYG